MGIGRLSGYIALILWVFLMVILSVFFWQLKLQHIDGKGKKLEKENWNCMRDLYNLECNTVIPLSERFMASVCRYEGIFRNLTIYTGENKFRKVFEFTEEEVEKFSKTVEKCIHGPICQPSWIEKYGTRLGSRQCKIEFNFDNLLTFCFNDYLKIKHVTVLNNIALNQDELFQLFYVIKLYMQFQ